MRRGAPAPRHHATCDVGCALAHRLLVTTGCGAPGRTLRSEEQCDKAHLRHSHGHHLSRSRERSRRRRARGARRPRIESPHPPPATFSRKRKGVGWDAAAQRRVPPLPWDTRRVGSSTTRAAMGLRAVGLAMARVCALGRAASHPTNHPVGNASGRCLREFNARCNTARTGGGLPLRPARAPMRRARVRCG